MMNPVPEDRGSFAFLLLLFAFFRDGLFLKQARDHGLMAILNTHGEAITYDSTTNAKLWELLDPDKRPGMSRMKAVTLQYYHIIGILHQISLHNLYSFSGWEVTRSKRRETRLRMATWVSENGDKARTAVLHASRLFTHCRENVTNGYQEPRAMLLACLVLWAYNGLPLSPLTGPFGRCKSSEHHSSPPDEIRTLRLDQETDIDNYQDWTRNGCHLRGFVRGLGNLHNPKIYVQVVHQGMETLSSRRGWPIGPVLASCLSSLVAIPDDSPSF